LELLLFCNVQHSSALVNLRVGLGLLLDRVLASSVDYRVRLRVAYIKT